MLQIPNTSSNGGVHTERKVGNKDRERNHIGSCESEHESLLTFETTQKYLRTKQMSKCSEQGKMDFSSSVLYFFFLIDVLVWLCYYARVLCEISKSEVSLKSKKFTVNSDFFPVQCDR